MTVGHSKATKARIVRDCFLEVSTEPQAALYSHLICDKKQRDALLLPNRLAKELALGPEQSASKGSSRYPKGSVVLPQENRRNLDLSWLDTRDPAIPLAHAKGGASQAAIYHACDATRPGEEAGGDVTVDMQDTRHRNLVMFPEQFGADSVNERPKVRMVPL
jgi:hypothetical protein